MAVLEKPSCSCKLLAERSFVAPPARHSPFVLWRKGGRDWGLEEAERATQWLPVGMRIHDRMMSDLPGCMLVSTAINEEGSLLSDMTCKEPTCEERLQQLVKPLSIARLLYSAAGHLSGRAEWEVTRSTDLRPAEVNRVVTLNMCCHVRR